ncbi:DNA helicase [Marinivivus vitaminiproducens]|uniref:DNA helicase n=1 Tax=Marinivivus vitaminiproducens TaxID=3035935 RepID=UPI0027AA5F6C|nr:DNA helicase [Geminicoccaceae bacterium SCSIO 64248]
MRLSAPIYRLKRLARRRARVDKIALHEALDRIAREEGFAGWSLLSSRVPANAPSGAMLSRLTDGDLLLLGARPGHGKTRLGLQLLLDAAREGRRAVFFTLEYTERAAIKLIRSLDGDDQGVGGTLEIVTSDDICAAFIIRQLAGSPRGTVALIDYLQILDQQRDKPPLSLQMRSLRAFARETGIILGFISQIDRSFDPEREPMPGVRHIRLPNPVELGVFTKACFLHGGEIRLQDVV